MAKARFVYICYPPHKWDGNELQTTSLPLALANRICQLCTKALAECQLIALGIATDTGLAPKAMCAYEWKARAEGNAIMQFAIKHRAVNMNTSSPTITFKQYPNAPICINT